MSSPLTELITRYRSAGVLVDTNILLLYFVGGYDTQRISRFKRTAQFNTEDYHLLLKLLSFFETIVTTPNVLSEVNNLSGKLAGRAYMEKFGDCIQTLDEHYMESARVARLEHFPQLGLTDSGIVHLAANRHLILTDDFRLAKILESRGADVLNFNHIRIFGWS